VSRSVLSIGGNLGERVDTLRSAVSAIAALSGVDLVEISPVYETPPWGPVEQPDFLNAVLVVEVSDTLTSLEFLHSLQTIENQHGRTRDVHWGPRTLDIDIVTFGDEVSDVPELVLPHPHAHEREFVLVPWLDIDGGAEIQGRGSIGTLIESLDPSAVTRRPDLSLR
jgi:2-amino-4-hydroxy-6-hydroxymethyldihydropteridine diphosphokinase